jgi:hypothetical protein
MTFGKKSAICPSPLVRVFLGRRLLNIGCEKVTEQTSQSYFLRFRVTKHLYQKWEKPAD